jgi:hypothetical protein
MRAASFTSRNQHGNTDNLALRYVCFSYSDDLTARDETAHGRGGPSQEQHQQQGADDREAENHERIDVGQHIGSARRPLRIHLHSQARLVEGSFSKLARSVLRHIRVTSEQELKNRLMRGELRRSVCQSLITIPQVVPQVSSDCDWLQSHKL